MTTLTWRQQAEVAFSSAMDGTARVTGSREAMTATALRAALDVAERAIAAERERIRQLARDVHASYPLDGDAAVSVLREFADLLGGEQ